jgi:hypothetical protein
VKSKHYDAPRCVIFSSFPLLTFLH